MTAFQKTVVYVKTKEEAMAQLEKSMEAATGMMGGMDPKRILKEDYVGVMYYTPEIPGMGKILGLVVIKWEA